MDNILSILVFSHLPLPHDDPFMPRFILDLELAISYPSLNYIQSMHILLLIY